MLWSFGEEERGGGGRSAGDGIGEGGHIHGTETTRSGPGGSGEGGGGREYGEEDGGRRPHLGERLA